MKRIAAVLVSLVPLIAYASVIPQEPQILFALPCWFAGWYISAIVHESGHALAALACRWRVIVFVVRPIGIQIPNRNVAIVPRRYGGENDGWVSSVPRGPAWDTQARWSLIVAAGPAASLLLAATALFAWADFPRPAGTGAFVVSDLGLGLALQSLYSGVLSLLPGGDGKLSDGGQLSALSRRQSRYEANRPIIWLATLLASNVRLSALPAWLVDEARALGSSSEEIVRYVATLDIGRLLDSAPVDSARARELIDAYRARYGWDGWLAACDAYLSAIWENDAERARAALAESPPQAELRHLSLAAEAAVAARMGHARLARCRLDDMSKALKLVSPFKDPTFCDIRRQIEALLA